MEWMSGLDQWGAGGTWHGMEWLWAVGWVLAGVFLAHLLWWKRAGQLTSREKDVEERFRLLERRQREVRQHLGDLNEREATFRRLEESLKLQTEQLQPQIEQLRAWVDQIADREETVALREAALDRRATLGESSLGG